MPMNLVIQEKRKELGFTQEQVAECLNVSIPAVSKWEKGLTCPDISLLPQLARLLRIDLNTLFCFQEDISQREIKRFAEEIMSVVQERGVAAGFESAEQKIHEYPHNDTLLYCLTIQLDGLLAASGSPADEMQRFDGMLVKWYSRLARSDDSNLRDSANYMLASRWIRKGDYDKAQEILDRMPDKENIISGMADKRLLQTTVYLRRGETAKAVKDLQIALLSAVNKVQILLFKLVEAELESGEPQTAESVADKTAQFTALFDFGAYNSSVAPLMVAASEKNAGECIRLFEKMLSAMITPRDMSGSPLFYRAAKASNMKQLLPALLSEMENSPEYGFLRDYREFNDLISRYKTLAEK